MTKNCNNGQCAMVRLVGWSIYPFSGMGVAE